MFQGLLRYTPYHESFGLSLIGYLSFYLIFGQTPLKRLLMPSRVAKDKEPVWLSYYASLFHAAHISISSLLYLGGYSSPYEFHLQIMNSTAYALVDMGVITLYYEQFKKSWIQYIVHHSVMISGAVYIHYYNHSVGATDMVASLYLTELSTITFNISWFMIHYEMHNHTLCRLSKNITVVNYLLFRIIGMTALTPVIYRDYSKALIPYCSVLGLNYYWFFGMLRNHFFGRNNKKK